MLEATWTSGGVTHRVVTEQRQGEAEDDFLARHANRVKNLLEQFPVDE